MNIKDRILQLLFEPDRFPFERPVVHGRHIDRDILRLMKIINRFTHCLIRLDPQLVQAGTDNRCILIIAISRPEDRGYLIHDDPQPRFVLQSNLLGTFQIINIDMGANQLRKFCPGLEPISSSRHWFSSGLQLHTNWNSP